jgi:Taurine catabolism dioxygenase TauD, TfdA family
MRLPTIRRESTVAETIAFSPALGAALTISNAEDLYDEAVISCCREALKWRGVLLIRGAYFDDAAQLAFSASFGPVLAPGGQKIFPVSLDPSKNPTAEYLKGTFNWHIDDTTSDVGQHRHAAPGPTLRSGLGAHPAPHHHPGRRTLGLKRNSSTDR